MALGELTLAEALVVLKPLTFFVMGMAIYAIFIFNFYRFLGRKDLFELNLERYEQSKMPALRMTIHFFSYVGKYLIFFPFVAFAWFVILTTLLAGQSRLKLPFLRYLANGRYSDAFPAILTITRKDRKTSGTRQTPKSHFPKPGGD